MESNMQNKYNIKRINNGDSTYEIVVTDRKLDERNIEDGLNSGLYEKESIYIITKTRKVVALVRPAAR